MGRPTGIQAGTAALEAWEVWHIHISVWGKRKKNGFSREPVAMNPCLQPG